MGVCASIEPQKQVKAQSKIFFMVCIFFIYIRLMTGIGAALLIRNDQHAQFPFFLDEG